jgi:RNA polymerase sigma-70 factor (ECF subfamily)
VLGGSGDAAETARDVVQETWIGAIRGLRGLRDPARFPTWIYGIATRKCADAIRAKARRRRIDARSEVAGPVQEALSPEHQIDLATAIRGLPPTHRAVIHLFYGAEMSVEEIASILKIPSGTVKSRLHHAREALRFQLDAGAQVAMRSNRADERLS